MREILAGRYLPINSQARHGMTESRPSRLPLPDEPLPKNGIDCSRWSRIKTEEFFKKRYSGMNPQTLKELTDMATQAGRIT
jgi:hypothetical protein